MVHKKGFTLIEVVIVTLIIAALALLVGPSFRNSTITNQMEKAKIGLVELVTAVKLYNEVNTTSLSGLFNQDMYDALSVEDENQGYIYLQNAAGRWGERSAGEYSLKDATSTNGILNCKYEIGDSADANILAYTKCKFDKVDEEGTECYRFYIEKANPAVIKKVRYEENTNECNDL